MTSGLPRKADIVTVRRHVSNVPNPEVTIYSITSSARVRRLPGWSAHHLCGFEIDDEFELGRLPYRMWGGLNRRFKSRINTPRPIPYSLCS